MTPFSPTTPLARVAPACRGGSLRRRAARGYFPLPFFGLSAAASRGTAKSPATMPEISSMTTSRTNIFRFAAARLSASCVPFGTFTLSGINGSSCFFGRAIRKTLIGIFASGQTKNRVEELISGLYNPRISGAR